MFTTFEKLCENPFTVALMITVTLMLMFYMFISPYMAEFPTSHTLFKAFIYMYSVTVFYIYMHSKTVKSVYAGKVQDHYSSVVLNKVGSSDLAVPPITYAAPPTQEQTANYSANAFL